MAQNNFEKNFDYGSFLPLVLFILGLYIIFLFLTDRFSQGIFAMIIAFIIYVANNIIINITGITTVFNEYLEDMASFTTFGLSLVIFGLLFYKNSLAVLVVVFFFSCCLILGLARNWVLRFKNSMGWPAPLNGIFFPLIFYIYQFYLQNPGNSVFIFYYLLVGTLAVSHYNFLGYKEESESKFKVVDLEDYDEEMRKYEEEEKRNNEKLESEKYANENNSQKSISDKLNELLQKVHHKKIPQNSDKHGSLHFFRKRL